MVPHCGVGGHRDRRLLADRRQRRRVAAAHAVGTDPVVKPTAKLTSEGQHDQTPFCGPNAVRASEKLLELAGLVATFPVHRAQARRSVTQQSRLDALRT
jgi:sugar phosphate isomerase/epimerase